MNRMRLLLSITLISLLPSALSAQIVPLILEETITLPVANTVWDIIPHSDGFYYFVQAAEVDTGIITIYTGNTNITAWTTSTFPGHRPLHIGAFYQPNEYSPTVILDNCWYGESGIEPDCTIVKVIDLESEQTLVSRTYVESYHGSLINLNHFSYYRLSAALLTPPPPAVTTQLSLAIGFHFYNEYDWLNDDSGYDTDSYSIIPDFISLPDSAIPPFINESGDFTGISGYWISLLWQNNAILSASSSTSSFWFRYNFETHYSASCRVGLTALEDTTFTGLVSFGFSYDPTEIGAEHCSIGAVTCTFDSILNCPLLAAYWRGELVGRSGGCEDTVSWSVPEYYGALFAVDAAGNDGREEILGYRENLESIHVYRWRDGWPYGRTSDITPNPDRIAIIGRFSDEFRRLALQYGNQVFLYSFGEYLSTDPDRPEPINCSHILLSSSPQPAHDFIQFKLSAPLATNSSLKLFNILGREVLSERLSPQTPSLSINISSLPSGVYFAAIDDQPQITPHKFIVLK